MSTARCIASRMQQSEDERLFEGVGRYMRYSQTPFDAHGSSYVCHTHSGKRGDARQCGQDAGTLQYEYDPPLCPNPRFIHYAEHADRSQSDGPVNRTVSEGHERPQRINGHRTSLRSSNCVELKSNLMDYMLIEMGACNELRALVDRLLERIAAYHARCMPSASAR